MKSGNGCGISGMEEATVRLPWASVKSRIAWLRTLVPLAVLGWVVGWALADSANVRMPPDVEAAQRYIGMGTLWTPPGWADWLFFGAWLMGLVGVAFLWRPGRVLLLAAVMVEVALSLLGGLEVSLPAEVALFYATTVMDGLVLGLSYGPGVSAAFGMKPRWRLETPDGSEQARKRGDGRAGD